MKRFLINLMLLLTAVVLSLVFVPVSCVYTIGLSFIRPRFVLPLFPDLLFTAAKSIDQFGNAFCYLFLNAVLIKHDNIHPFGDEDETISSVLGRNKLVDNLTRTGVLLDNILHLFDENHTIDAIGE